MKQRYTLLKTMLIATLCLIQMGSGLTVFASGRATLLTLLQQPSTDSSTHSTTDKFSEKVQQVEGRFDEKVKGNQAKFDHQINNPGSRIAADPKVKRQREKAEKARLEKAKKEEAKQLKEEVKKSKEEARKMKYEGEYEQLEVVKNSGYQVVDATTQSATEVVKSGAFVEQASSDKTQIVRAIRTKASVPIVNITPEKAREEAIRLAKEEAVKIAVGEEVNASTTVLDNGDNGAIMSKLSTIGSRGGIVALELINDTQVIDSKGIATYQVEIKVDVKIYPRQMVPSISFDVLGVKPGYVDRERLTFSVLPSDSSYVYIFLFDTKNEGTLLVPSGNEPENCLKKGSPTAFPSNCAIQYTLVLDNVLSSQEVNTLLIVAFTKKIPITPEISRDFEKTLCWINNIDPSQRSANVEVLPIRVYPKK